MHRKTDGREAEKEEEQEQEREEQEEKEDNAYLEQEI